MTRSQEIVIERLAEVYGRVHVREGYYDKHIRVTVPGGACWIVPPGGLARETRPDHSVDWSQ